MKLAFAFVGLPFLPLALSFDATKDVLRRSAMPNNVNIPVGAQASGSCSDTYPTLEEITSAVQGCPAIQPNGSDYTRNDIIHGVCKPVTLIFARGTTEDPNFGNLVGPPFLYALNYTFGADNVASQGVNDYAAIQTEYCAGGSVSGRNNLANLIAETRRNCPSTKLCVSGYSQGAQLVNNAFDFLYRRDRATANFVNSVVLFGDPKRRFPYGVPKQKILIQCHSSDEVCDDGTNGAAYEHLTYCHDVDQVAQFVKARTLADD